MQYGSDMVYGYLMQYRSDMVQWHWRKLVLLQVIKQVPLQYLEHQTCVIAVLETFQRLHKVVFIRAFIAQMLQNLDL